MTDLPRRHPDLLRRFVPTPYVFCKVDGPARIRVESNDLEIALAIRRSGILRCQRNRSGELFCKLIRDLNAPADNSKRSILSHGALRVLCMGRGTIVIYDQERSEILGFVSRNVKVHDLVLSMIPELLDP